MICHAGVFEGALGTGVVAFVGGECADVHESGAGSRARLLERLIPGGVFPETTADEHDGLAPRFQCREQLCDALLERGLFLGSLECGHVFAKATMIRSA